MNKNNLSWEEESSMENKNTQEEVEGDFQKITGFKSHEEMSAYDKGRMDEESVITDFVQKWDGSTNSVLGEILQNKFKEWQSNQPKEEQLQDHPIVRQVRVNNLLGKMMGCDMQLYERILDTTGFANYFNQLVQLALIDQPIPKKEEENQDEDNMFGQSKRY